MYTEPLNLLVLFVMPITFCQDHDYFKKRWINTCSLSNQNRSCHFVVCTKGKQSNETLFLRECNFQAPYHTAVQYLPIKGNISLTTVNCQFSKVVFKDIVGIEEPRTVVFKIRCVYFSDVYGHSFESSHNLTSVQTKLRRVPIEILKNETLYGLSRNLVIFFKKFRSLNELRLAGNRIIELSTINFSDVNALELLRLNLNKLTSIHRKIFRRLKDLRTLDISHPGDLSFGSSVHIKERTKRCRINELPLVNINSISDRHVFLNLPYNKSTNPVLPVFSTSDVTVRSYNNNISTITLNKTCLRNSAEPRYFLGANAQKCNPDLQPFLHVISQEQKKSRNLIPGLNTITVRRKNSAILEDIRLQVQCPSQCTCNDETMSCSRSNLKDAPPAVPEGVTTVNLNDNGIKSLKNAKPEFWNHVTSLNVRQNMLKTLNNWVVPENLEYLDLRHNRMQNLPYMLMHMISEHSNFKIYLSNNDWTCNCKLVRFKEWFMKHSSQIGDYDDTTCKVKVPDGGTEITFVKDIYVDAFCVDMQVDVLIMVVILPIVLVAILVFSYYYKFTILALLYSSEGVPKCIFSIDERYRKYDAFVCYNIADTPIIMEIASNLEPYYRLCIPERNWPKNERFRTACLIAHTLRNSRGTLIVISENSLPETWFQVKFRGAYNQRLEDDVHKMILIVVGDIKGVPTKNDIGEVISTEPCLEWGERWFWEKLRYELRRLDSN